MMTLQSHANEHARQLELRETLTYLCGAPRQKLRPPPPHDILPSAAEYCCCYLFMSITMSTSQSARPSNELLSIDLSGLKPKPDASPAQHQRNLNVALSHAFVIHHQKEVEAKILSDIEELVDLPATTEPTYEEAKTLLKALSQTQPSDFDDLVVERVSQSRCGHTLCARQPRSIDQKSNARRWRRDDEEEGFERWCSDLCMDKSLWLKRQLPTEPAWQRPPSRTQNITLHPHDRSLLNQGRSSNLSATKLTEQAGLEELARERGDGATSWKPKHVMSADVLEKKVSGNPRPPSPSQLIDRSTEVDGYAPANVDHTAKQSVESELPAETKHAQKSIKNPVIQDEAEDKEASEQQWNDMFEHLQITGVNTGHK